MFLKLSQLALGREALWEPLGVRAVIVNHIILLSPFDLRFAIGIHLLREPWICVIIGRTRRSSVGPNTRVGSEVPVWRCERRFAPISFNQTASGRPVVCVPKARIYLHRLALRVRHALRLVVLEPPDWLPIYGEAETEQRKEIYLFVKWFCCYLNQGKNT